MQAGILIFFDISRLELPTSVRYNTLTLVVRTINRCSFCFVYFWIR